MRIDVLGPPLIAGTDGLPRRERVVLSALVIEHGRPVVAEELAAAVWGEAEPASWANQIQICVAHLRQRLPAGAIETVGSGYRLTIDRDGADFHTVDVDEFEHLARRGHELLRAGEGDRAVAALARALALWRGTPFDDLDAWEPARSEVARLGELRLGAEEDLAEARLLLGDHRAAVAELEPLVARQPFRERRWGLLALAQYRSGRQAEALRTLKRVRRLLQEELGIDPGPELVALESAILNQDPSLEPPATAPEPSDVCPYKGLAAYDADDTGVFFGRNADIAACLERLDRTYLLVIAGSSGSGKSSLARAGIAPALRARGRSVAICVPGHDPVRAFTSAVASGAATGVVVIDQFEELFASPDSTREVFQLITDRVEVAPVVICVRADFVSDISLDPAFARLAEPGLYLVSPLDGDALREAIEAPAREAGLRLGEGLVDLLIHDTEGQPGALPMMSHALVQTWQRRDGRTLTVDGYWASGGIRGAVARSADQLYENLSAEQRSVLRALMLRLVFPSNGGEPVRSRLSTAVVAGDREREHVIDLLVRARLVTAGPDSVQLAHESLARAWPRLQAWLDEDVGGQRVMRHLSAAAAEWATLGRADGDLYRGARLELAREWRAANLPQLTPLETEFLEASEAHDESDREALRRQAARESRQNRHLRWAVATVALLAVIAVIAGAAALVQGNRTEDARAAASRQALLQAAVAARGSSRELAALLSVEAYRLAPDAASEDALLGLFTSFPGIGATHVVEGGPVTDGVVLPDGSAFVAFDDQGRTRLIEVATGRDLAILGEPADHPTSTGFAVTPDGRFLAAARIDAGPTGLTEVTVWDLSSRSPRFDTVTVPVTAGSVAVSADGGLVAVAGGEEGEALVIDGRNGGVVSQIVPIPPPDDPEYHTNTAAVAFASDTELVVTSQAGPIRMVDPRSGRELWRVDGPRETTEAKAMLSSDATSMVAFGGRGITRVDLAGGTIDWSVSTRRPCRVGATLVESEGLLLCGDDGRLLSYDTDSGVVVGRQFESLTGGTAPGASGDGSTVVVFGSDRYTVWKTDGSSLISRILPITTPAFVSGYTADGGGLVVVHEEDGQRVVEVLDLEAATVLDHIDGALDAYPTPNADLIAVLSGPSTVGWYDLARHRRVGVPVDLGFEPDGLSPTSTGVIAWDVDGHVVAVDLSDGSATASTILIDPAVWQVAVSPSDMAVGGRMDGSVSRFDPATFATEVSASPPMPMQLAAGDDVVLSSGYSGQHWLLDPVTLGLTGELPPTRGNFTDMVLSAGSDRLLALGADNVVRLYDVDARSAVGTGLEFDADAALTRGAQRGLGLSPDGSEGAFIANGAVAIWDLDPQAWVTAACEVAGRNLTSDEWATYVGDLADYRATCPAFPVEG